MNRSATLYAGFTIIYFLIFSTHCSAQIPSLYKESFVIHETSPSQCVSPTDAQRIWEMIEENKRLYNIEPKSYRGASVPELIWPVQMKENEEFSHLYCISNYMDHNQILGNDVFNQYGQTNLDFNCGQRTYDSSNDYNHAGVDIALWPFQWHMVEHDIAEVVAAADGVIIGKDDGYNDRNCDCEGTWNAVYIMHDDGSVAWYGHLKQYSLNAKDIGKQVFKGEVLGIVASSGCSTGAHLHFELYNSDQELVDPFYGDCNETINESLWESQQPYFNPTLNAVFTHSEVPNLSCTSEQTNFKSSFELGETIIIALYFRDLRAGDESFIELIDPEGQSHYTRTYQSSSDQLMSFWHMQHNLGMDAIKGSWTLRVSYYDQVIEKTFEYGCTALVDSDGDGYDSQVDCNDEDPTIFPGAEETCNGKDDNCDGQIDEDVELLTFYRDLDGDGNGNPAEFIQACVKPNGYVSNGNDCDDTNIDIYPGAPEICNHLDDNCDGIIDEGVEPRSYYADQDGDGYGSGNDIIIECTQPAGYVENDFDCNDSDSTVYPGAPEICNFLDDNCDGIIDEGVEPSIYFADQDGDGFGDANDSITDCVQPQNYVENDEDCDDSDNSIYPGAPEIFNNDIDEDCDGSDAIHSSTGNLHTYYNIYPNPASDVLNITFESEDLYYSILSASGILVLAETNKKQLDLVDFVSGMYYLIIIDKSTNRRSMEKLLIVH